MEKPAISADLDASVRSLHRWLLTGQTDNSLVASVRRLFGANWNPEDARAAGVRARNDSAFAERRRTLAQRWQPRMVLAEPLSDREAWTFLGELADIFDHALLYNQGVLASSTHLRRGLASDREVRMPGTMPCWTLHLTLRGQALYLNDSMEWAAGPGDMMLLRPDAIYHYGMHPMASEWEHLWVLFQPRLHWGELLQWPSLDKQIQSLSLPDQSSLDSMEALFQQLVALGTDRTPYQSELQHNRLEEILIRARCHGAQAEKSNPDQRIQRACEYMQSRLQEKFNVDEAAAFCNLSPSRFAHLFKRQMGLGPKAWINGERLQRARRLLLGSDESISAIGAMVGYDDPSHFTNYFRKNIGCSPREFRRNFRGASRPAATA